MSRNSIIGLALLAMLVLSAGCSSNARVQLRGIAPLNVNDTDESTPVDVRFFALSSDAKFLGAGFETLWTDAAGALGSDLIGKPVQAAVYPGGPQDDPVDVAVPTGGAGWIGIMALYRRSDGLPRTLAVRAEECDDRVLELTGYGMRWEGASKDGTVPGGTPPSQAEPAKAAEPAKPTSSRQGR